MVDLHYVGPEVYHFGNFDKNPSYCTPRMPLEKDLQDENVVKAHFPLPQDLTFLPSKMAQFLKPSDKMSHFRTQKG